MEKENGTSKAETKEEIDMFTSQKKHDTKYIKQGLVLPCAGGDGCKYNGGSYVMTSETGCGHAMLKVSKAAGCRSPTRCKALHKVYAYMDGTLNV